MQTTDSIRVQIVTWFVTLVTIAAAVASVPDAWKDSQITGEAQVLYGLFAYLFVASWFPLFRDFGIRWAFALLVLAVVAFYCLVVQSYNHGWLLVLGMCSFFYVVLSAVSLWSAVSARFFKKEDEKRQPVTV